MIEDCQFGLNGIQQHAIDLIHFFKFLLDIILGDSIQGIFFNLRGNFLAVDSLLLHFLSLHLDSLELLKVGEVFLADDAPDLCLDTLVGLPMDPFLPNLFKVVRDGLDFPLLAPDLLEMTECRINIRVSIFLWASFLDDVIFSKVFITIAFIYSF